MTGQGRRITVHEAQISTASVEIKTLTIRGKQVTLAVFRQLQDEQLIDLETAQLLGVPWGTVNYHGSHCKSNEDHLHVVWQKATELRRAEIAFKWPRTLHAERELEFRADYIDELLKVLFFDRKRKGEGTAYNRDTGTYETDVRGRTFARTWQYQGDLRDYLGDVSVSAYRVEPAVNQIRKKYNLSLETDIEQLISKEAAAHAAHKTRNEKKAAAWKKQAETMLDLDQLFIAV